jgi:hypothetical protein
MDHWNKILVHFFQIAKAPTVTRARRQARSRAAEQHTHGGSFAAGPRFVSSVQTHHMHLLKQEAKYKNDKGEVVRETSFWRLIGDKLVRVEEPNENDNNTPNEQSCDAMGTNNARVEDDDRIEKSCVTIGGDNVRFDNAPKDDQVGQSNGIATSPSPDPPIDNDIVDDARTIKEREALLHQMFKRLVDVAPEHIRGKLVAMVKERLIQIKNEAEQIVAAEKRSQSKDPVAAAAAAAAARVTETRYFCVVGSFWSALSRATPPVACLNYGLFHGPTSTFTRHSVLCTTCTIDSFSTSCHFCYKIEQILELSQQKRQQSQMISAGGAQSATMSPDTNFGQKLLPTMGMVPLNALK